jgi:hypothetical protein
LQKVERGLAVFIERDDFAVDDGVVGQLRDGFDHRWKAAGEVLLIARPELPAAS